MKLTPARRRWLYRVSIAAIPLGIALGWLDAKTAALAVPLLVALLNVPKGGEPKWADFGDVDLSDLD